MPVHRHKPKPCSTRCGYCNQPSSHTSWGQTDYPYKRDYGPVWICVPCQAWVGCHKGTSIPLGILANKELRIWKSKAHAAFDPLWQNKIIHDENTHTKARNAGYRWLAQKMGMTADQCHIGHMGVEDCKWVVTLCEAARK